MNSTLKRIASLTSLCIKGPGGKIGILYCFIVLALNLVEIQLTLKMITWNKDFFSALEKYDAQAALWQIGVVGVITLASASQYLIATYIRQLDPVENHPDAGLAGTVALQQGLLASEYR